MNVHSPQNPATSSARTRRGVTSAPVLGAMSYRRTERHAKVSEESAFFWKKSPLFFQIQSQLIRDDTVCLTFTKAHLPSDHFMIHRKFYQRTHARRQRELKPGLQWFASYSKPPKLKNKLNNTESYGEGRAWTTKIIFILLLIWDFISLNYLYYTFTAEDWKWRGKFKFLLT